MAELKSKIKVGDKFGYLTVLKLDAKWQRNNSGKSNWLIECLCDCGVICYRKRWELINTIRSCGCKQGNIKYSNSLQDSINQVLASYKLNAKTRNISWDLSEEQATILIFSKCFYCGIANSNKKISRYTEKIKLLYNGIDRIDNKQGYTIENSVPCCKNCNLVKRDMSIYDFVDNIKNIYNYLNLSENFNILELANG